MSEQEERPDFKYDGQLIFNGIRATTVHSERPDELKDDLLGGLSEFERGKPNRENEGFSDIDLARLANGQEYLLESDLAELASRIIDKKYTWENYKGTKNLEFVDNNGKQTRAWLRQTNEAYVYWDYPDYMLVQGAQGKVEQTEKAINSELGEDVTVDDLGFHPDFLLWFLYRHDYAEEGIPGPIKPIKLESSEVSGDLEQYGQVNRVEDSKNIGESLPIILALLQEMDFQMMEGIFKVNGYDVNAEIKKEGRIHVMVSGSIDRAETHLKRALIALFFVSEFVRLYREWQSMDKKEKYPPFTFFDDLAGTAAENNVDLDFDLDSLIEDFEEKRDERADPDDFDYIG
ncbi:hypothetical protein [Natronorubrum aibiense]|uniref:Uncharacterized protein n=1 Tax=Natronorubrum aibiense TaxID=348826 RepID=A0A5P9P6E9_9EURY|nr:hypothetical protein [Natronorubrum aibiense]QFU83370.1 hypothetical protein GCU68_12890 [Natronorubrum aibiense]